MQVRELIQILKQYPGGSEVTGCTCGEEIIIRDKNYSIEGKIKLRGE